MIRVLLIPSSDYLGHPFPQRHNQIFERLHDGCDVEVHVIRFDIFGEAKLRSKCVIHNIPLEFRISSTPLYYAVNSAAHASKVLRVIRQESIDIVVAGNLLPPFLFEVCKQIVRFRVPLIFDLQDYYPTSAAGYVAELNSFFGRVASGLFESITRTLIRQADAVTVPGIALASYAKRSGASRVYLIPNGISECFLERYDGSVVRDKLGYSEDDLVIGYVGSVEFWLDMQPLLKAASVALTQGIPVRLLIVGRHLQTGYSKRVSNWIIKYGLEGITTWMDFIPHEQVPRYIAAMNVGTIPFDVNNPTAYYSAPNKLWEYLSQGVTVAATPIPEVIVNKDFVNVVRDANDYLSVIKGYKIKGSKHEEVRKVAFSRSWSRVADEMKKILTEIVRAERRR